MLFLFLGFVRRASNQVGDTCKTESHLKRGRVGVDEMGGRKTIRTSKNKNNLLRMTATWVIGREKVDGT